MKRLFLAQIIFIFLSPINAEDNPFTTNPRYGHDPFIENPFQKRN